MKALDRENVGLHGFGDDHHERAAPERRVPHGEGRDQHRGRRDDARVEPQRRPNEQRGRSRKESRGSSGNGFGGAPSTQTPASTMSVPSSTSSATRLLGESPRTCVVRSVQDKMTGATTTTTPRAPSEPPDPARPPQTECSIRCRRTWSRPGTAAIAGSDDAGEDHQNKRVPHTRHVDPPGRRNHRTKRCADQWLNHIRETGEIATISAPASR